MFESWAAVMAAIVATPQDSRPAYNCPEAARATASAYRLSDLPTEIRADLMALTNNEITDENVPLLDTDAPTAAERSHATVRFAQAFRFRNKWLVQFEVALFSGVRTIAYASTEDGPFHLSPSHTFNGPACASIRAALEGVTTPGQPAYPVGGPPRQMLQSLNQ